MHGTGRKQHQAQQHFNRTSQAPGAGSEVARTAPSVKYSHTRRLTQR